MVMKTIIAADPAPYSASVQSLSIKLEVEVPVEAGDWRLTSWRGGDR